MPYAHVRPLPHWLDVVHALFTALAPAFTHETAPVVLLVMSHVCVAVHPHWGSSPQALEGPVVTHVPPLLDPLEPLEVPDDPLEVPDDPLEVPDDPLDVPPSLPLDPLEAPLDPELLLLLLEGPPLELELSSSEQAATSSMRTAAGMIFLATGENMRASKRLGDGPSSPPTIRRDARFGCTLRPRNVQVLSQRANSASRGPSTASGLAVASKNGAKGCSLSPKREPCRDPACWGSIAGP